MRKLYRYPLWIALLSTVLMASAALGGELSADLTCPTQATAGADVAVTMDFSNTMCSAADVRIISSVIGNASGTLSGIGIFGPEVAVQVAVVPAGTNAFCGCVASSCQCAPTACSVDADCEYCFATTPGTLNLAVDAGPPLQSSLIGTIATLVLVSEFEAANETKAEINECFVEVLQPS